MTQRYYIEIVETLRAEVPIEADSPKQAMEEAKRQYRNEDIILYPEDIADTTLEFSDKNICQCAEPRFWGSENLIVEGVQHEGELLIKSRDTEGIDTMRCELCGMQPNPNLTWQFI